MTTGMPLDNIRKATGGKQMRCARSNRQVEGQEGAAGSLLVNVERLRILAALGIVWFHTIEADHRAIGYTGLPCFLLIFIALISRKSELESAKGFVVNKVRRLIYPWVFWSLVYAVIIIIKQAVAGERIYEMFNFKMLLMGCKVHLWYLPFAFMVALLIVSVRRLAKRISQELQIILALVLAHLGLFLCSLFIEKYVDVVPFGQWLFALPSVPLGYSLGLILAHRDRAKQLLFLALASTTVVSACAIFFALNYQGLAIPYGIAIVLVCVAFAWPGRFDRISWGWGRLTYGIYLVHPIIAMCLKHSGIHVGPVWSIVLVFLCSSAAIIVFKHTPFGKFV